MHRRPRTAMLGSLVRIRSSTLLRRSEATEACNCAGSRTDPELTPASSSHASASHSRATVAAARRVVVLRALRALRAHLLLALQVCVGLAGGLPSVAAVRRPVAALAVIPIDRAIFAGVNIVLTGGNSRTS